jgi:uncharacterized repeat protein (TIGR01451 family)
MPSLSLAQVAGADVAISQALLTAPAQGGSVVVRITVTNIGDAASANFFVIGGISGAALNTIGGGGATCAKGRNSVYTCALGSLPAGASADLLLTGKVSNTATFTSNANLQSSDANFDNNRSTLTAAVQLPPPDVQISGSASTGSPNAGASFDYRYQIKVGGNVPATGVIFSDVLPPQVALVGVGSSIAGLVCDTTGGVVMCPVGDIAVGGQVQVTLTVTAPAAAGTPITNTAAAFAAGGLDAQGGNNNVTINVTTR